MKYEIEVLEKISKVYEIEAESEEQAIRKAAELKEKEKLKAPVSNDKKITISVW